MNKDELKDFAGKWLAAWTGNNPQYLLGFYTDDAFYCDPATSAGLKGKEQMLVYFSKLLNKNPDWKWTVKEIFPTEKGFTLKWMAEVPATERSLTFFGLDIVELQGGKITRNEVYFDRTPWMNTLQNK